ncbi:MAG: radical SAM protein [Candidatus Zapsychrus exili]|nr:radical SAM protein [Candidatus Zapsychrus exili]
MSDNKFKYIFGPVSSWRLGRSLGIDPISGNSKICNFNCIYCQLGETKEMVGIRKEFVSTDSLIAELKRFPKAEVDYYTFSSNGEPTLASNLGEMITQVKDITGGKVAVITNASLINDKTVQNDLCNADLVSIKLDANCDEILNGVNRPLKSVLFDDIIEGIKFFKIIFKGKLSIQVMFVEQNKQFAQRIAKIVKEIEPDEVQINTPLRPSAAKPLCKDELNKIKKFFDGLNVSFVYDVEKKEVQPLNKEDAKKRHGDFDK